MPRDAQGQYSLPSGTLVSAGQTIQVSQHNPAMSDIAAGLSESLSRTGMGTMQATLDMGGFPIAATPSVAGITNLDLRTGATIAVRVDSDQNVHVAAGIVDASGALRVFAKNGYAYSSYGVTNYVAMQFVRQVSGTPAQIGALMVTDTTVSLVQGSDYRLKNITGPISDSGAFIDALKPVQGSWKVNDETFVGFLAHEVQAVARTDIVQGVKDGPEMQSMNYAAAEIIANLVAELQSVRQRLALLEAR